jgi:WD40 repeat protein
VALKVIKLGMDTKSVVARFEAERQALAMMDHPNIAKVLDAGETETGRPYFVMELVRGIKVTEYCDQNKLATRERLDLFIKICQAVQHAHQKGIIHRDLKPSNILVTLHDGVPVPKVIDFGIAKATEGRLTDLTLYTELHQFIGTPAYMSPEQAEMSGLDIDTRSDIYSLGVLLYELLTGYTPFDAKELSASGLDAMRRTIREKDPLRPSTRLHSLSGQELIATAHRRGVEAPKLVHLLKGDLDWIVIKCLEKDRTRRYDTANGLASDLKRFLVHEPVVARPPSGLYRFQKLVRRNKLLFAAGTGIAGSLVLGMVLSLWQAVRATRAEREQSGLRQQALSAQASEARQKDEARQLLFKALLDEADAIHAARRIGYRDEVFGLLQQAASLTLPQKNAAELRWQAAACLGDFVGATPITLTDFPTNTSIEMACLEPTGQSAAFALKDGTVMLRQFPSGMVKARWNGVGVCGSLCFSASGDRLAVSRWPILSESNTWPRGASVWIWSRGADGNWEKTAEMELPGAFECLTCARGLFVTAFDVASRSGELIDLQTRDAVQRFGFLEGTDVPGVSAKPEAISRAALSPDGYVLAVANRTGPKPTDVCLDLWDLRTHRRKSRLSTPSAAHAAPSFSSDGKHLAYLSEDGGAIYGMASLEPVFEFKEYVGALSRRMALSQAMTALPIVKLSRIRIWDFVAREDVALLQEPEAAWPAPFSSEGKSLLTYGKRHARLYRLDTPETTKLTGHAKAATGVAFSPDGTRIVSIGKDNILRVCDALTGCSIWESNELPAMGQCLGYSPDGRWLATGDYQVEPVWIWDSISGKRLVELGTNGLGRTSSTEFSPDGHYLGAACGDGKGIQIWAAESLDKGRLGSSPSFKPQVSLPGAFEGLAPVYELA